MLGRFAGVCFFVLSTFAILAIGQTQPLPTVTPLSPSGKPTSPVKAALPAASPAQQSKPLWSELSAQQQISLKPLASQWTTISEAQKRKWIRIAENYASLPPAEQTKLHSRMSGWVALSPSERSQARLNFAETNKLSAEQKASTWEAYQALSPEDKQKLAAQAPNKPSGASAPIKPVSPQKLSVVPVIRQPERPTPKIAVSSSSVQSNTLLPQLTQQTTPAEPETAEKN